MKLFARSCYILGVKIYPGTTTRVGALLWGVWIAPILFAMITPIPTWAQVFAAERHAIAEAASGDEMITAFYRARDFEPIWTGADAAAIARRGALLQALERAHNHALPTARYDANALRETFRAASHPHTRGLADVSATQAFLQYARDVHSGVLDPDDVVGDIVHTLLRRDPLDLLTDFLESNPRDFIAALPPRHPEYTRIMRTRLEMLSLAESGGYGPTVRADRLVPGDSGPNVVALRNRLLAMGFLGRSVTATYDASIQQAVMAFQGANGIDPSGLADTTTLRAINRTVEDHLGELALALERQRWLNVDRGDRHIFVNITDFHTRVIDDGQVTFITRSVVGADERGRRTPEFSDMMEHMVINPSWYVPRSIARRSYIPRILAGRGTYMEVSRGGRVVNPANVDWSRYSVNNFPFSLRQRPGPRNALGQVKFMFPNPWNIYLHDTPERDLFNREVRTYSSGCVRLQDPFDFAYHLLAVQEDDPESYFDTILNTRRETRVDLDEHVPVHITYWTAWVSPDGRLNLRNDIYGRNAALIRALQAAGVDIGAVSS